MANDTHTLKIGNTTYDLAAKTWYPSLAITTDFDSQSNITAGFNVASKTTLHMPSTEFGSMNGCGAFMQFGNVNWKCQLVTGQRGPNYLRSGNASQATPEGLYWRKTGQASSDASTYTWQPWREIVSIDNTGTMKITHLDCTYHYSGGPTTKNQTLTIPYATSFSRGITGNVTGNVTGNCSGSSGSCTGNAATATTASSVPWTGVTGRPTALSQFTNDSGFISGSPNSLEMTGVAGQKTPFIDFHHYDTVGNDYDYRIICSGVGGSTVGKGTCTFEGMSRFKGDIYPYSDSAYSLGNAAYKWAYVHSSNVYSSNVYCQQLGAREITLGKWDWDGDNALHEGPCRLSFTDSQTYPVYIEEYYSPYSDGGADSLHLHGHSSVDIDSDLYVDAPYITQLRANDDEGDCGELRLTNGDARLRAENTAECSEIYLSPKRIQLTGGSEGIELNSSLCTVPTDMIFRPNAEPNTTSLGTSAHYWKNGYITDGYIVTLRSALAYSTYGFYESSDERLKNFGNRIPIDLDKISRLKKHYFEWKNEKESGIQIGVSAQEIKELYPELVKENGDGYLTVAYDKLSVVALAAIDELHEKNKELEDRIAKLEAIVNKLIDNE